MRIIQLSDIHVWRYALNPFQLFSKRAVGTLELLSGRARRFRLERLAGVVDRVGGLNPDHLLITGDLTTTALSSEFRAARLALKSLLADPAKVTVLPGNHDRYTSASVRSRKFESFFGEFAPSPTYPWLRRIDDETAILGLDPTRSHLSARGFIPPAQLEAARALIADPSSRPRRLIVACHYPLAAPSHYAVDLRMKRIVNDAEVAAWVSTIGRHLYCCGHVHAAWAFTPPSLPDQLCLNSGAPLLRDPTGFNLPGFLEITLEGDDVTVLHHAWSGAEWLVSRSSRSPAFSPRASPVRPRSTARKTRNRSRFPLSTVLGRDPGYERSRSAAW